LQSIDNDDSSYQTETYVWRGKGNTERKRFRRADRFLCVWGRTLCGLFVAYNRIQTFLPPPIW
jgi:hypothetical protein